MIRNKQHTYLRIGTDSIYLVNLKIYELTRVIEKLIIAEYLTTNVNEGKTRSIQKTQTPLRL